MLFDFLRFFSSKKNPVLTDGHRRIDYIIVGQGLAGTLLALELEKRGKQVAVVDDGWKSSASMVAAGVLNPVTGMRITKTLGVDDLLPAAKRVYTALGLRYKQTFFHEIPFYRFYTSEHEIEVKRKRAQNPEYADWVSPDVPAGTLCCGRLADFLGGFFVNRAGWLEIPKLLNAVAEDFRSRGVLISEHFECSDIKFERAGIAWKSCLATGGVIFADGFRIRENPWFGHLKWQPAKGEFVEVAATGTETFQGQILKDKVVAIPLGENRWRVGTNYEWETINGIPTADVGERLRKMFCTIFSPALIDENVRIVAHRAGVRPAVQGARPMVGPHEKFHNLFLFNGFGSKGVTWIPLYAERFAEKLISIT